MPLIFVIIVLLIQAILAVGHLILFKSVVAIFAITNPVYLNWLKWMMVFLAVSFVVASILAFKFYNVPVRWFYTLAAVWLGALLYLALAAAVYWLATMIVSYLGLGLSLDILGKFLLLLALLVVVYGVINANNIKVTSIDVSLPNNAWQGKRAVWVSDIHLGHVRGLEFINSTVTGINSINPDIIFIGGDLFDGTTFPVEAVIEPLQTLKAPLGVYFITGNHEEFGDNSKYLQILNQAGVTVLNNEMKMVDGVQLIGADFNTTLKQQDFEKVLNSLDLDQNLPSLLLKHAPFHLGTAANRGIDLQLSGHTHRAQMWPLNFITWLVYKGYDFGLKKFSDMTVYVSSGINTWGPPLKVGNPSEILLVNFK